jgi:hypothetical protein
VREEHILDGSITTLAEIRIWQKSDDLIGGNIRAGPCSGLFPGFPSFLSDDKDTAKSGGPKVTHRLNREKQLRVDFLLHLGSTFHSLNHVYKGSKKV